MRYANKNAQILLHEVLFESQIKHLKCKETISMSKRKRWLRFIELFQQTCLITDATRREYRHAKI